MNETTERQWESQQEAKVRQINEMLPGLMALHADLRRAGVEASAVMLPQHLNPMLVTTPGLAPSAPVTKTDQAMGLPVIWGARAGLVVEP
jgi:hypothetical protein